MCLIPKIFRTFAPHFQFEIECKDKENIPHINKFFEENFPMMNERLRQFIEYLGLTTRQFEQKISASDGQIAKLLRQNTTIQSNTIAKIKESFPKLSLDWLVSGRGEMLLGSAPAAPDSTLDRLLERIEDLARENGQLQAENAELKKELARAGTSMAASATAAAG